MKVMSWVPLTIMLLLFLGAELKQLDTISFIDMHDPSTRVPSRMMNEVADCEDLGLEVKVCFYLLTSLWIYNPYYQISQLEYNISNVLGFLRLYDDVCKRK